MDPGEGTSDGRVKHKTNRIEAEIKQETDIEEEQLDGSQLGLVTRPNERFEVTATSNIKLMVESEYDFVLDFDLNGVKEEVKCKDEKPDKGKDSSAHFGDSQMEMNRMLVTAKVVTIWSSQMSVATDPIQVEKGRNAMDRENRTNERFHGRVRDYVTSQKGHLTAHNRIHTGDKPYKCDDCSKSFALKGILNQHKKIHSEEKRFECLVCFKCYAQKSHLNSHLRTHTDELPHSCSKCGQRFAGEEAKQSHQNGCKQRRYECYLCEHKGFRKGNLKTHMQSKHTGEHRFQCEICGKKFIQKNNLNGHLATHRNQFPFECSKCQRGFTNTNDQGAHEKICRRRQHQCYMCEYFTLQSTTLRNHMRGHHTGEKPFQCKWCNESFSQRSNASTHMKRRHLTNK